MKPNETTKKDVMDAFVKFAKGERPPSPTTTEPVNRSTANYYYVIDKNGTPYPAKQIWWLASGHEVRPSVHINGFKKLGYKVVDTRISGSNDSIHKELEKLQKYNTYQNLKARANESPKKPKTNVVVRKEFVRNKYVIAAVLKRAKGKCECCGKPAPFKRKDGSPYLEVHHRKQLAKGGNDTIENAFALCPNCHRHQHHGKKPKRLIVRK